MHASFRRPFFSALAPALGLALSLSLSLSGCSSSSEKSCTLELRTAVRVQVTSPEALRIDAVSVTNSFEAACVPSVTGQSGQYDCYEQGIGQYTVRVKSGTMTWSKSVSIAGDECHVSELKTLEIVLQSTTAD